MPRCMILRFQDASGVVPFDEWLGTFRRPGNTQNLDAARKLAAAVTRLAAERHALRRPTSAPLRDGLYELRVEIRHVNYRALYSFAGAGVAVLVHGCTKEGEVAKSDLDRAVARRLAYEADPRLHTAPAPQVPHS